jgi:uncharacterized protein YbjT (DUF2867 family)
MEFTYGAAASAGPYVALSVVRTERLLESGYFRAKLAQEKLIKTSPIPYSIVCAAQFFEFVEQIADYSTEVTRSACLPRWSTRSLPMM